MDAPADRRSSGQPLLRCALAMTLVSALQAGGIAQGAQVQLFQPQAGNVFFTHEPLAMRLVVLLSSGESFRSAQPVVRYRVLDFWGKVLTSGQAALQPTTAFGGRVDLAPSLAPGTVGWFKVELELADGDRTLPLQNPELATQGSYVTFAVVPPPVAGPQPASFFGICEHWLDETNAEVMERAGIRWLRIDVGWGGVQARRGADFNWARFDGIVAAADRHHLAVLPIIDYTAPFAAEKLPGVREGDPSRYPPREEDWRRFVRALVERYREAVHAWEVWNEANIGFWLGTPAQYAELLRQAYEEVRGTDPAALVSIAGTSGVPIEWFKAVAAAGAGPFMDVVSVHPYRQPSPPEAGLTADLVRIREWSRSRLSPAGSGVSDRPVWITEMGYHTLGNAQAVSETNQAAYLVRAMVQAMAAGVERFFWYEFADGAVLAGDQEANFGLVYHDLTPKPAYVAYAVLERALGQATAPRTVAFNERWLRAYAFDTPEGGVLVAWSLDGDHDVRWPALGALTITDLMGNRRMMQPGEGSQVAIPLSGTPVYLQGIDLDRLGREQGAWITTDPLAITPAPASSGENRVPNAGFEESGSAGRLPAGWEVHISRNAQFSWEYRIDAADAKEGRAYLRLRNETPIAGHVYGRIHRTIRLEPWTTYTLTAWVRTSGNAKAWIGGGPGWALRFELPQDTGGEWRRVQGIFTTGPERDWDLMILLEDIDERVDVDDVRVVEGMLPPGVQ